MKQHELDELTPEEKRIRIAEACGWKWQSSKDYDAFYSPDGAYRGGATHDLPRALENAEVPDYLNSLDAMHPVEIAMFKDTASDRWTFYTANLCNVVDMDSIISATAAQRADAFLLTIG